MGAFGTLVGRVSFIIRRNSGALPGSAFDQQSCRGLETLEPATTSPSRVPPLPYLEFKPVLSLSLSLVLLCTRSLPQGTNLISLGKEVLIARVENVRILRQDDHHLHPSPDTANGNYQMDNCVPVLRFRSLQPSFFWIFKCFLAGTPGLLSIIG